MSEKWIERLEREIKLRGAILLSGNTGDIVLNPQKGGQYTTVVELVRDIIFKCGYEKVIIWNRAEGGSSWDPNSNTPSNLEAMDTDDEPAGEDYFSGSNFSQTQEHKYPEPKEFFPYLRKFLSRGNAKAAAIIDYSDYLFGDGRSLSEEERKNLTDMMIAITRSQNYNLHFVDDNGNLLVLVARTTGLIPPSVYVDNPQVASITVPMPSRSERESFVNRDRHLLKLSPGLEDNAVKNNFVDALDGFGLKNIAQIIKLSNQTPERMNFEKLINLYRYGEKISPWEELSYEKLKTIEETLRQRVKGQDDAVKKVRDVIIRAYTGFSGILHSASRNKPKGALFFVGPTGVGKTELAKTLAAFVFGDESSYRRFDMSEYAQEQSDQRLIGAPPGYVGYEKGGDLTNAVKEKPFCVLLFDEIEKADGRIMDKFLQILEDGRLTDGKGETVHFSETIIIFTSNIGAAEAYENLKDASPAEVREHFISAVKKYFVEKLQRPEILNRIGDANIVPFNFIRDEKVFAAIGKAKFAPVKAYIKERYKAEIKIDEDRIFAELSRKLDVANGGRGMLNAVDQKIIDPLSDFVFENQERLSRGGRTIKADVDKAPSGGIALDFYLE